MLRDRQAQRRILSKLDILAKSGHTGPTRSVGEGILEMKLYFGPGYRIYYRMRGTTMLLLLSGGDKTVKRKTFSKPSALQSVWTKRRIKTMAVELRLWDAADYLNGEEDIAEYLRETILSAYPGVYGTALESASRARGGVNVLARESGVIESEISQAIADNDERSLLTLRRVQISYEQGLKLRRVA